MELKCYPVMCSNITAMTDKGMMVLQNHLELQEDVPGSYNEACSSLSLSDIQAVNIKVEEFSDIEDSEDTVPMAVEGIKAEHEVSCVSPL
jgi:hypothetical protein